MSLTGWDWDLEGPTSMFRPKLERSVWKEKIHLMEGRKFIAKKQIMMEVILITIDLIQLIEAM